MDVAFGFQRIANCTNPAVHHVAGCHDVHARPGLAQRLTHQHGGGFFVHDVAMRIGQAVLAVGGEGVERHIGHHAQLRKALFKLAHHTRHQAIGVGGFHAVKGF